ncbi:MAG: xylose isomerase, partial [Bacteroidetes bacterium]|nr:xylose isomerase [Bacteroidota bacterium]
MKRRNFIKSTAVSGMALTGLAGAMGAAAAESNVSNSAKFKLKYAPG